MKGKGMPMIPLTGMHLSVTKLLKNINLYVKECSTLSSFSFFLTFLLSPLWILAVLSNPWSK